MTLKTCFNGRCRLPFPSAPERRWFFGADYLD
jgi:hypothetical protein